MISGPPTSGHAPRTASTQRGEPPAAVVTGRRTPASLPPPVAPRPPLRSPSLLPDTCPACVVLAIPAPRRARARPRRLSAPTRPKATAAPVRSPGPHGSPLPGRAAAGCHAASGPINLRLERPRVQRAGRSDASRRGRGRGSVAAAGPPPATATVRDAAALAPNRALAARTPASLPEQEPHPAHLPPLHLEPERQLHDLRSVCHADGNHDAVLAT